LLEDFLREVTIVPTPAATPMSRPMTIPIDVSVVDVTCGKMKTPKTAAPTALPTPALLTRTTLSRLPLLIKLDAKPAINPTITPMEAPMIADSTPLENELTRA
jgi:hypothetical protein